MRVSNKAAAESKARILATASAMIRERGIEATSVADVMHASGMTHGGFYKHFDSKQELTRQAVRFAFDDVAARFDRRDAEGGAKAAIRAYIEEYLSAGHVLHPEFGCPMAALGTDAGRHSDALAPDFDEGAEKLIARISRAGEDAQTARAEAIRTLTQLVGAIVVARAVGPGPLRDEVIANSAEAVAAVMEST